MVPSREVEARIHLIQNKLDRMSLQKILDKSVTGILKQGKPRKQKIIK
jgi:hypothetical protein